jgi:hypothetical protein
MNFKQLAAQNEVYSAFLSLKYGQKVEYRNNKYNPSRFEPSKEDLEVYKECKGKYLVSDNPLAYLLVKEDEQKEYKISFFYGLATSSEEAKPDYIMLLDARMTQIYNTYYLSFVSEKDVLLIEELANNFKIEILAVADSLIFCKSKNYNKTWLLNALKRVKEGLLPILEFKPFVLSNKPQIKAFNRLIAIKSYLNIVPHLYHLLDYIKVGTDGRVYFPLGNEEDLNKIKKEIEKVSLEFKNYRVNVAITSCDDSTLSFCFAIRKYLDNKGYKSYLVSPKEGKEAKIRYVITDYNKEVDESEIKDVRERVKDINGSLGYHDYLGLTGLIKEVKNYELKLKESKIKVESTFGPIILKVPEDADDWTKEYYRYSGHLSALNEVTK